MELLGNLCQFLNGGTPAKSKAHFFEGDIPWITSADITGPIVKSARTFITEQAISASATNKVFAGTVLLVTRTGVGKVAIASVDLCFSQDITALIPDSSRIDTGYLLHFLRTKQSYFLSMARGATIKGITRDVVSKLKLPLPSLAEQRRIAAILDKADTLRVKRRDAVVELDRLARSIFVEMFGDPLTNSKGWPEGASLGEVADIVSGVTKGRKLEGKTTREVPYLAVANVQEMRLNMTTVKRIDATEEEIKRYALRDGDLLLTEGGDPDKLGRGTLWHDELPECIHQNHVFRVRVTADSVTPCFLNWLVGSQRGKRYFLKSAKQTTGIASINMTQLRGFPLLLPPVSLQLEFEGAIGKIQRHTARLRSAMDSCDALFETLQDRAFRGAL